MATGTRPPTLLEVISYAGYRFPPDVISYAVWLYYRFPLSLRMVGTAGRPWHCRYHTDAKQKRALRTLAFEAWESVTGAPMRERLAD
jgi:hypothetical protein